MKNYILILFTIITFLANAQDKIKFEYENFEIQLLNYKPIKNSKTSEKDFDYAKMILKETKSATKNNPTNFVVTDYFNVLSAFLTLNEGEENIKTAFEKFKNANGSCEYILSYNNHIKTNPKYDIIRADYLNKLKDCKTRSIAETKFNIDEYCKSNSLNIDLVKKINQVKTDDLKYRNGSSRELLDKQKILDIKNQKIITSLYKEYNTYLGKSLVGEKFESVMWAVIQHSNPEMMSEYLPIIQKAVKERELGETPLKMMIDRYYGLTYGYQIFGSQSGFGLDLADEKKRKEIKLKYEIE